MRRVASLFLPYLAVERLRRLERASISRPKPRPRFEPLVDDDPSECSVPRGGGWRPGARWARDGERTRSDVEAEVASLPAHRQPPMHELGRRSEAAQHAFRHTTDAETSRIDVSALVPCARPLALVDMVGRQQTVTAACPVAQVVGVTVGMAATHARVLASDLDVRPADPEADAQLLVRLTLHAVRSWTPIAAVSQTDGLWLDLTGCAHLLGGEERLCQRLVAFCARIGFTVRVAVADTAGAAHGLARHAEGAITIVPTGKTLDALMPLPLAALRLEAQVLTAARRLGFERIGDLVPVARGPLARRLGRHAIERLDQALGRVAEPITPAADPEASMAERRLLEPIATAEAIKQVMADLLTDLVDLLRARGLGARALRLECQRIDGTEQIIAVGTSCPTRDAVQLLRMLALRIERIDPGLGLERFRLVAVHVEPLGATTLGAVLAGEPDAADVPRLVDGVVGRIGPRRVFRVASVDSHVPERVVTRADPLSIPAGWPSWKRPARLLARPEPLSGVIALLPDQPPRRFEWRGIVHTVVAADGPERIHGEWWRRDSEVRGVRDYFRLENEAGARFWVFRRGNAVDADTGDLSWWLHGLFG